MPEGQLSLYFCAFNPNLHELLKQDFFYLKESIIIFFLSKISPSFGNHTG